MSDGLDPGEATEPSPLAALREQIAATRAELSRAAELLEARARATQAAAANPTDPSARPAPDAVRRPGDDGPTVQHFSARQIEVLPAPGRNLPARRSVLTQQNVITGLLIAAVVYLLTRRRR